MRKIERKREKSRENERKRESGCRALKPLQMASNPYKSLIYG
jgi:hypothetical protein